MNRIKAIRESLGLTQEALAEGIGCTQGNVGHYEQGQTMPPRRVERLIAFAKGRGLRLTMGMVYGHEPLPIAAPAPAYTGPERRRANDESKAIKHG